MAGWLSDLTRNCRSDHQGLPETLQPPGLIARISRWITRCKNNKLVTGPTVFAPIFHDSSIPLFHLLDKRGNIYGGLYSQFIWKLRCEIYFDLSSFFVFFFLGRLTPNVPLHIFPRLVFLSPLPKVGSSFPEFGLILYYKQGIACQQKIEFDIKDLPLVSYACDKNRGHPLVI